MEAPAESCPIVSNRVQSCQAFKVAAAPTSELISVVRYSVERVLNFNTRREIFDLRAV